MKSEGGKDRQFLLLHRLMSFCRMSYIWKAPSFHGEVPVLSLHAGRGPVVGSGWEPTSSQHEMAALPCLAGMESGFAISSAQQQDQADGMRDGNEHTQAQEERSGGEGRRGEERPREGDTLIRKQPPSLEG